MTGKDILDALNEIDEELIDEADDGRWKAGGRKRADRAHIADIRKRAAKRRRRNKRIAAGITAAAAVLAVLMLSLTLIRNAQLTKMEDQSVLQAAGVGRELDSAELNAGPGSGGTSVDNGDASADNGGAAVDNGDAKADIDGVGEGNTEPTEADVEEGAAAAWQTPVILSSEGGTDVLADEAADGETEGEEALADEASERGAEGEEALADEAEVEDIFADENTDLGAEADEVLTAGGVNEENENDNIFSDNGGSGFSQEVMPEENAGESETAGFELSTPDNFLGAELGACCTNDGEWTEAVYYLDEEESFRVRKGRAGEISSTDGEYPYESVIDADGVTVFVGGESEDAIACAVWQRGDFGYTVLSPVHTMSREEVRELVGEVS